MLQNTFYLWIVHLKKGTWPTNIKRLVENMALAIETNELHAVKNSARILVKSHDFWLISSFEN